MSTNPIVGRFERLANPLLNAVVVPIMRSPLSRVLQPFITTITYTGRRSGTTFTTPVLYRKRGDGVIIWVASPDSKKWWRNFLDDGAPITLDLPDGTRSGLANARRDPRGAVTVRVSLNPEPTPPVPED